MPKRKLNGKCIRTINGGETWEVFRPTKAEPNVIVSRDPKTGKLIVIEKNPR